MAGQVLTAIVEALRQGDMASAVELVWLSIKLVWQKRVTAITLLWLRVKYFFLRVAVHVRFHVLVAAVWVRYKLKDGWIMLRARGRR